MASIYVSLTGNDSTGNGTSGNRYRTVSKALTVALGGDTILMAPGLYQENTTNGTLQPRICYASTVTVTSETGVASDVTIQGSSGTTAELFIATCANITF